MDEIDIAEDRHSRIERLQALLHAQHNLVALLEIATKARDRDDFAARIAEALNVSEVSARLIAITSIENLATEYSKARIVAELAELRAQAGLS